MVIAAVEYIQYGFPKRNFLSVSITSKSNVFEIHISQELDWRASLSVLLFSLEVMYQSSICQSKLNVSTKKVLFRSSVVSIV